LLHIHPLTLVPKVSELLESSSPYLNLGAETSAWHPNEVEEEMEEAEEIEWSPVVVPFSYHFVCVNRLN